MSLNYLNLLNFGVRQINEYVIFIINENDPI